MEDYNVEISLRGKRVRVPALHINGNTVIVTGKWIKVAEILDDDWQEGEELENLESYINMVKEHRFQGLKADLFTVTQKLPDTSPKYSYPMEWDNVAAIRLKSFEEWWRGISRYARTDIRKAEKRGVVTKLAEFNDDLVRGIVEINNESPIRQGRAFSHYQEDFESVKRAHETFLERSSFIGAYYKDELIGYMKIVRVGKVAAMMQLLSKIGHYDKRPSNALIAKAVEHCAKMGMSYLTYGRYRYGNKGRSSLTNFKHRCGFEEIRVPRFYVPMTTKGRICARLGLHRELVGILPEWLIYPLLRFRRIWYKLLFSAAKQPMEQVGAQELRS